MNIFSFLQSSTVKTLVQYSVPPVPNQHSTDSPVLFDCAIQGQNHVLDCLLFNFDRYILKQNFQQVTEYEIFHNSGAFFIQKKKPTLKDLILAFPLDGLFHFRLAQISSPSKPKIWIDVSDPSQIIQPFINNQSIICQVIPIPYSKNVTPYIYKGPSTTFNNPSTFNNSSTLNSSTFEKSSTLNSSSLGTSTNENSNKIETNRIESNHKIMDEKENKSTKERVREKLQQVERQRSLALEHMASKVASAADLQDSLKLWGTTHDGSYKDLRTLLSTVHTVLWDDAQWTPLSISELLSQPKLKRHYRNALLLCHPDKLTNAPPSTQARAEYIFTALSEAMKFLSDK